MSIFAGIDVGASTTKAVLINESKEILGYSVVDSGADFKKAAQKAFKKSIQIAQKSISDEFLTVATGYGRRIVPFSDLTKTEISCHARGSFHFFPYAHTLVDIGGQDSKVIKVDKAGKRMSFKMNRKCAAGTGAFLEEIARRLRVRVSRLNDLAASARNHVAIGSYCTVFTATEILTKIREGIEIRDIVKGIFESVIKRALEMDSLDGNIVMSGGVVAHNPYLVKMFEETIGKPIFIPPLAQLTGAFGAAVYALEAKGGEHA